MFFLDIDGVMVPAKSWKRPELLNDGFPAFSNKASNALNNILSKKNITIMLTTSHKSNYNIQEWKKIFWDRGVFVKNIKTLPENKNNLTRKEELINWFNVNKINEDFFIIDDDKSLNDLPIELKNHLIQTSSSIGLTEELLSEIINF